MAKCRRLGEKKVQDCVKFVRAEKLLDVCRLVIIQEDVRIRAHVKGVRRDILRVCMMTSSKNIKALPL